MIRNDRMSLSPRLLRALSRPFGTSDYAEGHSEWNDDNALIILKDVLPDFLGLVRGRKILDFGCGEGLQSIALFRAGAAEVVGVDTNQHSLQAAISALERRGLSGKVQFTDDVAKSATKSFDLVISQNSMEHFPDPKSVLQQMINAVKPSGMLLITFGPPWYAPYGSHMQFFTKVPWVNLLFSESTVMTVRQQFRDDGARRYEEVESGLNKMSVRKFERLLRELDLNVVYSRYDCVKGLRFLGRLPLIRELFVNHITVLIVR